MKNFHVLLLIFTLFSCNKTNDSTDKSSDSLTHDDVLSLEKTSVFSNESLIYEGNFEGKYYGDKVILKLENTKFVIEYKNKTYKGDLFKKEDGSLMEIDVKNKKIPFQFFRWSDNTEIMILNNDGMADENGENYLTRISN